MTPPTSDEQDLRDMARLAAGQDSALNDLMERHSQRVFHYLLRALQNEEDAADLAQETFVRVYRNRRAFNSKQKFTTWLYAVATNLVKDRFRWRSRHPAVSFEADGPDAGRSLKEVLPDSGATPEENLQASERAVQVRKAVGALPEELREPLLLAVYEDLSQAEIAEILKCSTRAVENKLYRARNRLRESLARVLK
jgi:RNA polymerase sigma-70 factor (ECF subfamily)